MVPGVKASPAAKSSCRCAGGNGGGDFSGALYSSRRSVRSRRRPRGYEAKLRKGKERNPSGHLFPLPVFSPKFSKRRGGHAAHVVPCKAALDRSPSVEAKSTSKRDGSKKQLGLLQEDVQRLRKLLLCLNGQSLKSQIEILRKDVAVKSSENLAIAGTISSLPFSQQCVVYSILALRQEHVLKTGSEKDKAELLIFLQKLELVQQFYDSIGGIIGYHLKVLELIIMDTSNDESHSGLQLDLELDRPREEILFPHGHDIGEDNALTRELVHKGIASIPQLAEVYPVGGAGDRLGLIDETTGQPLPTALLPYCGRSLLESLVRDVQARENLYFRLFKEQHCTPIAIMTSDAKGNHEHITQICEDNGWFGRRSDSFFLFKQPLVPVVNGYDGKWLVCGKFEILMKPSGHGAIWKLMYDKDVLRWFGRNGKSSALVRQISNPMAATDTTMIALAGKGYGGKHSFGFASCERKVGASEGCNVTKSYYEGDNSTSKHAITCVEYTEFEKYGLVDSGKENSEGEEVSRFPANTNILYFDVEKVLAKLDEGAKLGRRGTSIILPGMIFNRKKTLRYTNNLTAEQEEAQGGRLECSMQSLADVFSHETEDQEITESTWLPTFLLYNKRPKVTSSAKKRYEPSSKKGSISQTPEGSFYDLMRNAGEILRSCDMEIPALNTVSEYLEKGPSFVFLFHPALGPLWSVISQKIRGGSLGQQSELVLEISEVDMKDVHIEGSLTVHASDVMGATVKVPNSAQRETKYSDKCGKCRLENVTVENKGIDYTRTDNIFWKHDVKRLEKCEIILHGHSEFEAKDVKLSGNQSFEVPHGQRMRVSTDDAGNVSCECTPLAEDSSWVWQYSLDENGIKLK